jgi:Fic family protein
MGQLEKFLHDDPAPTPILVKAALAHAQFETIHPFLDGNGRVGRLLVTLLLCTEGGVLSRPLLYLSLYLKENRDEYYERLQRIRTHGEWEEWLRFFLDGVVEVSASATETTRRIVHLVEEDRRKVMGLARAAGSALRVHELVTRGIVFTVPEAARAVGVSEVTAGKAARHLEQLGIVREITGRSRNRLFVYYEYLRLLQEGVDTTDG